MGDRIYRFDGFELHPNEGELRTKDSCVRLQEKPLQLLTVLLENPQRVVTRIQLRDRMWDSETFVDYEQGINVAIKKIRDALGDSADEPKFIQTVAKKGYRFLVPVEVLSPEPASAARTVSASPATSDTMSGRGQIARNPRTLVVLAIGVLCIVGIWLFEVRATHGHSTQIHSLAVLPLRDLSPDAGQEYFADGITEELITDLAQTLPLRVISRTSVMRYKQTNEPITQIGRELGVEAIVEGAVARSGNQVTVTVQLIDATEDRHLWAQKYDRSVGDLLGMEAELSQQIASQVGGTLVSARGIKGAKPHQVDPRVYELYLKGRYFWNKRTGEGYRKAAEYYQQAADLDPNYAPIYVGLADCYLFSQPPTDPPKILVIKAKEMANKALQIDQSLGEAHATLGLAAENFELDWAEAEKEYKRAIELNPNYATAHQWYGEELALMGRFDEALAEMKVASELDPLSLIIIKDSGEIYYLARRYDRAIEYFRKTLEMDPNFVIGRVNLGLVYAAQGEFSSAVAELQRARQLDDGPNVLTDLAYVCAVSGRKQEAQEILRELKAMSQKRYVYANNYAAIYAGLGEKRDAFEWLERSYSEGGTLTGLKVDPRWDKLRGDPRFADLLKRVGLEP